LTHAIALHGTAPLHEWASAQAADGLRWWEYAAGAAASSLTVHALLAAAADPATTSRHASQIETAYLSLSALSTLLDSLIDYEQDTRDGSHSYVAYYADRTDAAQRITAIARHASSAVRELRHAHHHTMTVAGVAGYYLSAPGATGPHAQPVAESIISNLQPAISPILAIFWLWRRAK
jgi:tetraprenyl-beta-curcumene synthase